MVLVRRRRSFKTIRRWTKATIRFWTNWWTGISIWTLAFVVARFFGPLASLGVAFWLCCEAVNYAVFCAVFAPRLIRFSAADARDLSRGAVSEASFAAAVDHVCFLIEKDPGRFWQRVTGIADIDSVPVATALSFVKSLLFVFDDDEEEEEGGEEQEQEQEQDEDDDEDDDEGRRSDGRTLRRRSSRRNGRVGGQETPTKNSNGTRSRRSSRSKNQDAAGGAPGGGAVSARREAPGRGGLAAGGLAREAEAGETQGRSRSHRGR